MADDKKYKIQLVESITESGDSMVSTLTQGGYQVNWFKSASDAIEDLNKSKDDHYALIISSYQIPETKGDEFLKQAQDLFPDTQRMIIAEADELQSLVSAINQAGIHACLTLPVQEDDLLCRVENCCEQYTTTQKQKNLKRVTKHQNKQLFQIASNLKKKDDLNVQQLKEKDKEIRVLESRIQSAGGSVQSDEQVSLKDILEERDITISPEDLANAFVLIKDQIKQILETAASTEYVTLNPVSYEKVPGIAQPDGETKKTVSEAFALINVLLKTNQIPDSSVPTQTVIAEVVLDDHFELSVNEDFTEASIKVKTNEACTLQLAHVKQLLEKNKVINGVQSDEEIKSWICAASPDDEPFMIARGRKPKHPANAEIRYHFPTDYLHAGKVNEDGSINFRDRGEIPYVDEGAFLAAKVFPEAGSPGVDVLGREIEVDEPEDLTFSAGPGTRISEDGVRIYATTAGQPHLDAMGNISVCPEYQLKGDLGFDTGDVNFDGNVVVNGTVKQGFKVQCASLTAKEIEGAEIDISGDLNVSLGIVDAKLVNVKGSVQAKFIHNSKISAFGDMIIQKEIIDSNISLSGACINERGSIINSQISAKMGIDAGNIGNISAKPSSLTVGVDEHVNLLVAKVDSQLNLNNKTINEIKEETAKLEKEDQSLHASISQHAYTQDRAQLELKDIEKKMEDLKASGNMAAYQKVSRTVEEIRKNADKAEEKINEGFDRQDEIALEISQKKNRVQEFIDQNKQLMDKKKRLLEFSNKKEPLPEVKVAKKVESGTKIFSANASLVLHNSSSRCRIREYSRSPDGVGGVQFYEIKIGEY